MRQINEAVKIWSKFTQMDEIKKGKNVIVGREGIDVIEGIENVKNLSHVQIHNLDKKYIDDEEYDNMFLILFTTLPEYLYAEYLDKAFSKIKPNGIIILYIPHKMYLRGEDYCKSIPHDMALELNNVKENKFELKDMATCKPEAEFSEDHMEQMEYAFYIILHKKNNLFRKNVEFKEADGQMVSLDD